MFEDKIEDRDTTRTLTRRSLAVAGGFAAAGAVIWSLKKFQAPGAVDAGVAAEASLPKEVKIVPFSASGKRLDPVTLPTVVKSDAEWRRQLSYDSYNVLRHSSTERPYSGDYWNNHEKGLYRCIGCDTPLFNSDTKFESGTGWPSFWQPIAKENVRESADDSLGVMRTEVLCRRCDGHLGHVFNDGPEPTGLRYCMNSVSLRFARFA